MNATPQRDLIFDLGMHQGHDSRFYLAKGFRVVGLEAVPGLCAAARTRLADHADHLTIVNKALSGEAGTQVTFYTVPEKDDWGSLYKNAAEKGVQQSLEIEVTTTDLAELLDAFGVPHYVKCDLEGADVTFRDQLLRDNRRPTFVSLEVNSVRDIEVLEECGYDRGSARQSVDASVHARSEPGA